MRLSPPKLLLRQTIAQDPRQRRRLHLQALGEAGRRPEHGRLLRPQAQGGGGQEDAEGGGGGRGRDSAESDYNMISDDGRKIYLKSVGNVML